jgi:hypothetical protein
MGDPPAPGGGGRSCRFLFGKNEKGLETPEMANKLIVNKIRGVKIDHQRGVNNFGWSKNVGAHNLLGVNIFGGSTFFGGSNIFDLPSKTCAPKKFCWC